MTWSLPIYTLSTSISISISETDQYVKAENELGTEDKWPHKAHRYTFSERCLKRVRRFIPRKKSKSSTEKPRRQCENTSKTCWKSWSFWQTCLIFTTIRCVLVHIKKEWVTADWSRKTLKVKWNESETSALWEFLYKSQGMYKKRRPSKFTERLQRGICTCTATMRVCNWSDGTCNMTTCPVTPLFLGSQCGKAAGFSILKF